MIRPVSDPVRCAATTKAQRRCRNNAIPGTNYCYIASHGSGKSPLYKRALNLAGNHRLGTVLGLVGLLLSVVSIMLTHQIEIRNVMTGILHPPSKALFRYISIGAARIVVNNRDGVLIRDGNEPVLTLELQHDKLFVSAIIRDSAGAIIAELTRNEWELNRNSIFDRNYTAVALEVRDVDGNVVLQVVHFGDTVHVAGLFQSKNGALAEFAPAHEHSGEIDLLNPGTPPPYQIMPICEYPSNRHLGSCPGVEQLKHLVAYGEGRAVRLVPADSDQDFIELGSIHGRIIIGTP